MATETMLAVVKRRPQRGANLERVNIPHCHADEVLVRLRATSICGTDVHIYNWDAWAQQRVSVPRIIGHEAAGEVVEVGRDVQGVAVGDFVSAETHIPCGYCYQCRTGKPEICQRLKILGVDTDGVFAQAMAFPTVPRGTARLRLMLSASHSREDLAFALQALADVGRACRIVPSATETR